MNALHISKYAMHVDILVCTARAWSDLFSSLKNDGVAITANRV